MVSKGKWASILYWIHGISHLNPWSPSRNKPYLAQLALDLTHPSIQGEASDEITAVAIGSLSVCACTFMNNQPGHVRSPDISNTVPRHGKIPYSPIRGHPRMQVHICITASAMRRCSFSSPHMQMTLKDVVSALWPAGALHEMWMKYRYAIYHALYQCDYLLSKLCTHPRVIEPSSPLALKSFWAAFWMPHGDPILSFDLAPEWRLGWCQINYRNRWLRRQTHSAYHPPASKSHATFHLKFQGKIEKVSKMGGLMVLSNPLHSLTNRGRVPAS